MKLLSTVGAVAVLGEASERVPIYMYVDNWTLTPSGLVDEFVRAAEAGVSTILMAFHLEGNPGFPTGVADTVAIWDGLTVSERAAAVDKLHGLGVKLMISSGGESEGSYWLTQDPEVYAEKVCNLVRSMGVDGVDWDKEGFGWVTNEIESWVDKATKKCREVWPGVIITSAPQSPHFNTNISPVWADGLNNGAGHDYYLIQYYNQGTWTQDTTYEGLMNGVGVGAIKDIWARYPGVGKDRFVIGKPFLPEHGGTGYVEHNALRQIICKAWLEDGYRGGIMFWKLPVGEDLSDITMLSQPCDPGSPSPTQAPLPTNPAPLPTNPATVPTNPATVPTNPATVPTIPATVPTIPAPLPTNPAPLPTNPATVPTNPVTKPGPPDEECDAVRGCEVMVKGSPGYEYFTDTCISYCAQYGPGGNMTAWCPRVETAEELVDCVLTQHPFCVKI